MFSPLRPRNFLYVGVYLPPDSPSFDTEYWATLAKFIHETFGHETRAVYLSCGSSPPTAKITLGRFLDGYNKILLESSTGNDDLEMLIAAETGLILLGGGGENNDGNYIARIRNKPETTYRWENKKTGFAATNHEPRNCPVGARVQAAKVAVATGAGISALPEFPR